MDRVLVIGATGQLGWATMRKLQTKGARIRALVRSSESAARFRGIGIEPVLGDLTDPASLIQSCAGMTTVIATANAAVPTRPGDTFEAVERHGYRSLIQAATAARIRRFVYTSVPLSKHPRLSQLLQFKRETEQALADSGLDHVIFRAEIFMDVAFAMMGSAIPIRGSECVTVLRPFAFPVQAQHMRAEQLRRLLINRCHMLLARGSPAAALPGGAEYSRGILEHPNHPHLAFLYNVSCINMEAT